MKRLTFLFLVLTVTGLIASPAMAATLAVRARGTAGSESVNLTVGGSTVATWTLTTTMATRSATTSLSGACNVQFTNDASGRDVQVDYLVVDGSTRQAENQVTNTGVWQNSKCGGSNSEWLHCNGYIGFGDIGGGTTTTTSATSTSTTTTASSTSTTTTASSTSTTSATTSTTSATTTTSGGSNTIVVRSRGVAGSESVNLTVGGSTVATWTLTTTMTDRTASTNNTGAVNVQFTNDASGRDVQVDYIVVNGSTRQAENQATNTGVWQNSSCGGSNSEWLHCNGYIGFGDIGGGTTTTTSATSTSTTSGSTTTSSATTTTSGGCTIPPMPSYSALPTNSYLPDPFMSMGGSRITTKAQWTCRRAEIAAQAQEYELGYMQSTPYSATTGSYSSNSITVNVSDNGKQISFSCSISYPTSGSAPYPAMIGMNGSNLNNTTLRSLGVAVITFPSDQVAQQNGGSSRGVGKFYDMYGSSHSAGALMAWAWGVDRLIDALEKTPAANIDPARLGVTGCSRNGKGALIAGCFCERIKLTIPQESGSGGAASWRVSDWQKAQGQNVQTLSQIVTENVWFRSNFSQFSSTATKLPYDHHGVAGLCAPRALLFIENSSMEWLGNVSTWTTGNVAHKIWESLDIPDKMGYSSVGHSDHCTFPSTQQPEVTAYVQKFLVGGGTGNTNVMKCDGGVTYNESQWVNWTVPDLQ